MTNIQNRISLQKSRFALIERATEDALDTHPTTNTRSFITTSLEVLESNWIKFQNEHDNICEMYVDNLDMDPYIRTKTFERCQQFYIQARSTLLNHQELLEISNPPTQSSEATMSGIASVNLRNTLPRITIPKFSGEYHEWRSFHDLFSSMVINNSQLSDVERMHYLKTSLTGEAARLILSLPVSGDTFPMAWKTLIGRYENKRILISTQLDKLLNLKPVRAKSARDLSQFLSSITETLNALRALGCVNIQEDPLLLHLLVRLLDTETREAWELQLGSITEYPNFYQFQEFLTSRSRAFETLTTIFTTPTHNNRPIRFSIKQDSKARSYFATVTGKTGGNTCLLCKSNHFLSSCPKYLAYDAQRRLQEVKKLKLCYNCLGNHTSLHCNNIRRCRNCGKKHHTTLHRIEENSQMLNYNSNKENYHNTTTTQSTPHSNTK